MGVVSAVDTNNIMCSAPVHLEPAEVRRNDTSAVSINEWTGERLNAEFAEDVQPQSVNALGNYAAQILWEDGFNQVAPYELLMGLQSVAEEEVLRRVKQAALAVQEELVGI